MSKGIWRKGLGLTATAALTFTFWGAASAEPQVQPIDAILSDVPEVILDEAVPLTVDSATGNAWNKDRTVSIRESPDGLLSVEMPEEDLGISLPVEHSGCVIPEGAPKRPRGRMTTA